MIQSQKTPTSWICGKEFSWYNCQTALGIAILDVLRFTQTIRHRLCPPFPCVLLCWHPPSCKSASGRPDVQIEVRTNNGASVHQTSERTSSALPNEPSPTWALQPWLWLWTRSDSVCFKNAPSWSLCSLKNTSCSFEEPKRCTEQILNFGDCVAAGHVYATSHQHCHAQPQQTSGLRQWEEKKNNWFKL